MVFSNSPKNKWTNSFLLLRWVWSLVFAEEFEDNKRSFWNCLTFVAHYTIKSVLIFFTQSSTVQWSFFDYNNGKLSIAVTLLSKSLWFGLHHACINFVRLYLFLIQKAKLSQVGIFFALNFLPWKFLSIEKLEIKKNRDQLVDNF